MKPTIHLRRFLLGLALTPILPATAADRWWDGNDNNANANGGAGTWDTGSSTNWDTLAFGGADSVWTDGDTAVFGGTAGTVTIGSGGVTAGGLTFNTTAYTIAAGTNGLTFGSGNNSINNLMSTATNATTITGLVGGTGANLIFSSHPLANTTLTFNGTSAGGWTGTTTINPNYTVAVAASSQVLLNTSAITLNGGGITLTNTATGSENTIDRVSDSAAISSYGNSTIAIANTATANRAYSESIGSITHYNGQLSVGFTTNQNQASNTQTLTLAGLTRSGSTSTIAVSGGGSGASSISGNSFIWVNGVTSNTAAGEIVGPWMTAGTATNAQSDWAVYSSTDGSKARVTSVNIAASDQSTWSTVHAATSNYTLNTNTVVNPENGRLTADRYINTLRTTQGDSSTLTVDPDTDYITMASNNFQDGDVVLSRNTTGGQLTQGRVYYVINKDGAGVGTFQVSTTPGGSAVNLTTTAAGFLTSGVNLNGNTLGTYGILTGSTSIHGIGGGAGSEITLPTTTSDNLYLQAGAGSLWVDVPIVDNGAGVLTLVKGGTSTATLNGTNTYTGGTVINAGTLTFNTASSWVSGQNITFGGSGTITASVGSLAAGTLTASEGTVAVINGSSAITFNTTSGTGTIIRNGGSTNVGNLNLGDASGFTGNLQISQASGTNPRPTVLFSSLGDGGALQYGGGQGDSNQRIAIQFNGSSPLTWNTRQVQILPRTSSNNAAKSLILENNSSGSANTLTINTNLLNSADRTGQGFILGGSNGGNNTFAGVIGNSTLNNGALGVFKNGTGKWILSGANTFTGRMVVGQGTLAVGTLNEVGVAGPLGMNNVIQLGGDERAHNNATELILSSNNSGTLEYTGGAVTSTRQFFIGTTLASATGGGGISNNGTGAITFSNPTFNPTQTGITGTRTLTLGGSNTAANEVQGVIQDNVASSGAINLAKSGDGRWIVSNTNTYTGTTTINGGALQATDGTGLPTNSILQLRGGVFQSSGTFTRNVGTSAGNVNWSTGSGGFAAIGGTLTLNLNGGTGSLTWNGSSMVSTGQTLIFGSTTADSLVDWQNDLNLGSSGSGQRTIQVDDNTGSTTDIARISGAITNTVAGWGIVKEGTGTLQLTNSNTYTGTTTINAGTLVITGATQDTSAITFGGGVLGLDIASPVTAASATVDFTGQQVLVTGSPILASYTLLTASSITGTPTLASPIPGYTLAVESGTILKLNSTGAPVGYAAWQAANGTGGTRDQDHDNDGVDNGTEHFLGGDTNTTGFTPLPGVVNTGGILSVTWVRHPNYSTATFPGNYGTDFVVETSTTLAGPWTPETPAGTNVIITGNNVTYTFPGGPGYSGKRFARLKVTGP